MKPMLQFLVHLGLALLVLWFALAGFVWQIRNPMGSKMTSRTPCACASWRNSNPANNDRQT